ATRHRKGWETATCVVVRRCASSVLSPDGETREEESVAAENPLAAGDIVGDDLLGAEPEGDLALCRRLAVAAVARVVLLADREITGDGPGSGRDAVGRAEEGAYHGDGLIPFQDAHNHGSPRDEIDQALEKGLADVFGIVLLGQRAVDLDEL